MTCKCNRRKRDMGMPSVSEVRWAEGNLPFRLMNRRGFVMAKAGNPDAAMACWEDAAEQMEEAMAADV